MSDAGFYLLARHPLPPARSSTPASCADRNSPRRWPGPLTMGRREALRKVDALRREFGGPRESGFGLLGGEALGIHHRSAVVGLQPQSSDLRRRHLLTPIAKLRRLVRHLDRLAEMGDRLLEGRAAQRLIARLAPPFDREIVEAGLR